MGGCRVGRGGRQGRGRMGGRRGRTEFGQGGGSLRVRERSTRGRCHVTRGGQFYSAPQCRWREFDRGTGRGEGLHIACVRNDRGYETSGDESHPEGGRERDYSQQQGKHPATHGAAMEGLGGRPRRAAWTGLGEFHTPTYERLRNEGSPFIQIYSTVPAPLLRGGDSHDIFGWAPGGQRPRATLMKLPRVRREVRSGPAGPSPRSNACDQFCHLGIRPRSAHTHAVQPPKWSGSSRSQTSGELTPIQEISRKWHTTPHFSQYKSLSANFDRYCTGRTLTLHV